MYDGAGDGEVGDGGGNGCRGDGASRGDGDDEWCILSMSMAGDERLVPIGVRCWADGAVTLMTTC